MSNSKKNTNSNAGNTKNYWLLFKQGLRGVFSSKTQFIVIFTLSILSISLLTGGITSFSRVDNNQQDIFKNTPQFDYDFHYSVETPVGSMETPTVIYPLLDLEYAYSYTTDKNDNISNTNYNLYFAGDNCQGTLFDGIFDPQNTSGNYNNYLSYYANLESTSFIDQLKNDLFSNLYSAVSTGQVGYEYQGQDHYHDITQMTSESLIYQYFSQIYDPSKTAITDYFFLDNFLQYEAGTFYNWANGIYKQSTETIPRVQFLEQNILGNTQNDVFSNENTWIGDLKYDKQSNSYHPYTYSEASDDAGGGDPLNSYVENWKVDDPDQIANSIDQKGFHGSLTQTINYDGSDIFAPYVDSALHAKISLPLIDKGDQIINDSQIDDESYLYFHTKMAAQICNFDVDFRNESYVKDDSNDLSYRVVFFDNANSIYGVNNPDVTLIKGVMPKNPSQLLVSPQFAKSNHWNVGDWISINNKPYQISGIGTDPFSFIPTSDNDNLIPDIASSGVIFAPQADSADFSRNGNQESIDSSQETHVFLTQQDGEVSDINLFNNFLGNNGFIIPFASSGFENNDISNLGYVSNITSFANSPYSKNWTIFPKVLSFFKIIVYISSVVILLICLVSVFVSIRKNIEKNSSQIAILKSMGTSNNFISFAYLSYAFIITVVAVPLGWLLGTIFQFPLCGFFDQFFSLNYSEFTFNFLSFVICLTAVGLVSILSSYFSAIFILKKPVISIINKKDSWTHNQTISRWGKKMVPKKSFNGNFRVNVLSSSVKNVAVLSLIIFIASFIMTIVLSLPSIFTNLSDSFFKDMNYKNEYSLISPIYNSPLSKYQTNLVTEQNVKSKDYSSDKGYKYYDNAGQIQTAGGYDNLNYSFDSSGNSTPIPYFVFDQPDGNSFLPEWTASSWANDPSRTYTNLIDFFGNNFYAGNGSSFSVGDIDGILSLIYEYTYLNAKSNPEEAQKKAINVTSSINDSLSIGIVQILQQIFNNNVKPDSNLSWQEQIVEIILGNYPSYIQQYVYSDPSREDQFTFGWDFYNSIEGQEALVTDFENTFSDGQSVSTYGLDRDVSILNLSDKQKQEFFVDDNAMNELELLLNSADSNSISGDITTSSGYKIYDKTTNTILLPTFASPQALLNLGKSDDFTGVLDKSFSISGRQELQYKDAAGNFVPLNKSDWVYDDSDFFHSEYFKNDLSDEQKSAYFKSTINLKDENPTNIDYGQSAYLNPFELSNNSFSFKNQYNGKNISENSFGTLESYKVNNSASYETVIRPYYEFNNLHLYIPDASSDAWQLNITTYPEKTDYSQVVDDNATPPDCVKETNPSASKWVDVKPYDLNFSEVYDPNAAIGVFFNGPSNWLTAVTEELVLPTNDSGWKLDYNYSSSIFNNSSVVIKYNILDQTNTYGSSVFYIDNKLSNLIYGFSPTGFTQTTPLFNDDSLSLDVSDNFAEEVTTNYSKISTGSNMWYNSCFSNVTEPMGFTTQGSIVSIVNSGSNLITSPIATHSINTFSPSISSMDLLAQKETYVNNISTIFIGFTSFFIVFIVLCSTLLILLISNLFVSRYYMFLNQMKAEGYSKKSILSLTLNNFTPFVLLSWLISSLLSIGALWLMNSLLLSTTAIILPFGFDWYNIFITLFLILVAYSFAFLMAYIKLRKNPSELLTTKIV
ncbi:ABC transporter permease [Spiroplasma endosymbiont of Amphibalanus improvisus]|uniref:ABC transporter permease n=1 Tax=Spiroplasma endosymbiont of Amphibalanus improvisus TaxID=3066327 RepID=UPI00313B1364